MSDLTPDSPEVQFCAIYCGLSKQHALESLSETKNQEWRHVAAEHNRLVAQAVKAARIEALREAHSAILTLQRRCKETPEGQSASMIYGHAGIAIELLMQSEETPRPIDKEESK